MKSILLLAILLISATAFAGNKKTKAEGVTTTRSLPAHPWNINLDKVSKHTRNISMLQPVIAVIKAVSRPQPLQIMKQKTFFI